MAAVGRRRGLRARSQAAADGATLNTRSPSAGSSAHGMVCSRPGGTTTTGPSPRCRDGRAEQRVLEPRPGRRPGWPARCPGRRPAGCGPGGAARSGRSRPPGSASSARPAVNWRTRPPPQASTCRTPSTSTISISWAGAELIEQIRRCSTAAGPPAPALARGLRSAARARDRALEPQLLPLERGRRARPAAAPCSSSLVTWRSAARPALSSGVGRRPHRRDGQRGGPPALAPGQQQPGPAGPRGVPLRERGQLGAVRGGLRPQFRRAQGEPVLVQDLEAAAAGGQQAARIAGGLRPQRLAEPAAGPGHRRAAPAAARPPRSDGGRRRRGGPGPAPPARPAGAPARPRRSRAASSAAAARLAARSSAAGRRAGRVLRPGQHQPGVGLPPGALLGPEQAVAACARSRAACGCAAASAQLAAISSSSAFMRGPAAGLLDVARSRRRPRPARRWPARRPAARRTGRC